MIREPGLTDQRFVGTDGSVAHHVQPKELQIRSPLAVERIGSVGDTLLFAATALLAGFSAD